MSVQATSVSSSSAWNWMSIQQNQQTQETTGTQDTSSVEKTKGGHHHHHHTEGTSSSTESQGSQSTQGTQQPFVAGPPPGLLNTSDPGDTQNNQPSTTDSSQTLLNQILQTYGASDNNNDWQTSYSVAG